MKKILAFLTALALISAVSCSNSKPNESVPTEESVAEIALMSFKSADINMADDFSEIINTDKRAGYYLIFGKLQSGEYCGYVTDTNFAEKKTFSFKPEENEVVKCAVMMRFGKTAVLTELNENAIVYTFDKDGNHEKTLELGEIFTPDDHFAEILSTEDGFYINIDRHTLAYFDADGNYKGEVDTKNRTICGIINDSEDKPCVLMSEGINTTLGTLSSGEISEETECGELADYTTAISTGLGDYRIAVVAVGGLYGLQGDKWVKLTDFSENDFSLNDVIDMNMTSENEFVITLVNAKYEMRLLSQRDISELKQKKVIKMANLVSGNSDPYDKLIKKYNSENEDYKIEIVSYNMNTTYYSEGADALKLDIVSGKAPDIVVFDSENPVESYGAEESIFVDMYTLMDNDSDINRSDFLDGFLEKLETNGRLLQITQSFSVSSNMIKSKYANGLTSWNFDEFEEIYNNKPENMVLSYYSEHYTKAEMANMLCNFCNFYDTHNAECHFDKPEFLRTIKFIKENDIGKKEEEFAGTSFGGESVEIYNFRNDEVLMLDTNIGGFTYLKRFVQVYSDEDVTFIGFPSEDRIRATAAPIGTYGIMANSDNIEGAWDFLKYYLFSEESFHAENNGMNFWNFSGIEKFYNEQLEKECTYETYINEETGEEVQTGGTYVYFPPESSESIKIELQPFTEEEAKKYDELIRTAVKNQADGDYKIYSIVNEELVPYFENERSAEDAIEIIQNRVSLYLSENYG